MLNTSALSRLAIFIQMIEMIATAEADQLSALSRTIRIGKVAGTNTDSIADAIEYITDHFQDPLELSDVLGHISMSRASFSRRFTLSTGQTFTTFLQQVRLEHCRRILATTTQTVTEAAFQSGFQNLSHFNRLFRQRWGITPRDFRRELSDTKVLQSNKPIS